MSEPLMAHDVAFMRRRCELCLDKLPLCNCKDTMPRALSTIDSLRAELDAPLKTVCALDEEIRGLKGVSDVVPVA